MLLKRLKNDGKSLYKLDTAQKIARGHINSKIKNNVYVFERVLCCICNGNDFKSISEKDRYGLYMPVKVCKKCGLVQTNPRMSEKSYESFYRDDQKYLYTGNLFPTMDYMVKQIKRGRKIHKFLSKYRNIEGLNILEIGCSSGGVLQHFKNKNNIFGCDLNADYVNFGKNCGLNLEVGTLHTVKIPWKPDIVIYSHTLEHILDPVYELKKLRSIVKEDTLLYIEVPGLKNLKSSYNVNIQEYLQNAHVYHFTLRSLENLMGTVGWSKVYGDEYIRAVFKHASKKPYKTDYPEVIDFLKKMEWYRYIPTFYKISKIFSKLWKN